MASTHSIHPRTTKWAKFASLPQPPLRSDLRIRWPLQGGNDSRSTMWQCSRKTRTSQPFADLRQQGSRSPARPSVGSWELPTGRTRSGDRRSSACRGMAATGGRRHLHLVQITEGVVARLIGVAAEKRNCSAKKDWDYIKRILNNCWGPVLSWQALQPHGAQHERRAYPSATTVVLQSSPSHWHSPSLATASGSLLLLHSSATTQACSIRPRHNAREGL